MAGSRVPEPIAAKSSECGSPYGDALKIAAEVAGRLIAVVGGNRQNPCCSKSTVGKVAETAESGVNRQ
jgi:hypothetical protein